jgi:hypothetical protein
MGVWNFIPSCYTHSGHCSLESEIDYLPLVSTEGNASSFTSTPPSTSWLCA